MGNERSRCCCAALADENIVIAAPVCLDTDAVGAGFVESVEVEPPQDDKAKERARLKKYVKDFAEAATTEGIFVGVLDLETLQPSPARCHLDDSLTTMTLSPGPPTLMRSADSSMMHCEVCLISDLRRFSEYVSSIPVDAPLRRMLELRATDIAPRSVVMSVAGLQEPLIFVLPSRGDRKQFYVSMKVISLSAAIGTQRRQQQQPNGTPRQNEPAVKFLPDSPRWYGWDAIDEESAQGEH